MFIDDSLVIIALFIYAGLYHVVMSHKSEHESLTKAALSVRATSSELIGNVSRHVLPTNVAFKDLNILHEAVKSVSDKSSNDFLTVIKDELIFSYSHSYEKSVDGKRKSDMAVEDEVTKMMSSLPEKVDSEQLTKARGVIVRLLRDMKGTQHESLVQSVLLSYQKLRSVDENPRLVIAVRLASGVPIPVGKLKGALGVCWQDGAITIDDSSDLLSSFKLPVTEEGKLAMEQLGHKPIRLVTAVP
jgi:hypothetical protein